VERSVGNGNGRVHGGEVSRHGLGDNTMLENGTVFSVCALNSDEVYGRVDKHSSSVVVCALNSDEVYGTANKHASSGLGGMTQSSTHPPRNVPCRAKSVL
jgi:hypothetical protein